MDVVKAATATGEVENEIVAATVQAGENAFADLTDWQNKDFIYVY